jgi:hypothetical protein
MKTKKKKKHTIERKMQISKVDETYCVGTPNKSKAFRS